MIEILGNAVVITEDQLSALSRGQPATIVAGFKSSVTITQRPSNKSFLATSLRDTAELPIIEAEQLRNYIAGVKH